MIGTIRRLGLLKEKKNLEGKEINALRLIVTVTANLMDSKICSLWILDEKDRKLKLKATQSISEEYLKERSLAMGEGVVGHVAFINKPIAIFDVLEDPLYK